MSKTKIVILKMREIVYTAIFAGLGILLLIILFFMFWPGGGNDDSAGRPSSSDKIYHAGIYNSEIDIGENKINLQVTLDETQVKSAGASVDEVVLSDQSQYTEEIILDAVNNILSENEISNSENQQN